MAKEEKQDWKVVLKKNGKKITSVTTFPGNWTTGQVKDWFKTEVLELTKLTKVKEEEQMSPENEMTPKQEMRYADDLASRLPKDLTTEEEILAAGFKLAEKDIGRRSAVYYFQYDEDFASDFVSAYKEATPLGALSGQTYESMGQRFLKKALAQEGADKETLGQKIANKIMGAAPREPKYKVGDMVSFEMSPPQKDGSGTGKITKYDKGSGFYTVNGRPVNHFEIKKVIKEAKDDSYYTLSSTKAAELMKERFGPTTRSTDKDGRWIFKDKDGVEVALSDIDGEGDRTWNIFRSKAIKEAAKTVYKNAEVIKTKKGREVGELYQDNNGWGCFHYKADSGFDSMNSRKQALDQLKEMEYDHNPRSKEAIETGKLGESLTLKEAGEYTKAYDMGKDHALNNEKKHAPWPKGYPYDLHHKAYNTGYKDWKPKQAPKEVAPKKGEEQIKESMIRDMMKLIPRGILGEEVDMEAVRALSDDKLKEMIKDFESQLKMGDSNAASGLKALRAEAKRRDSAGFVEEDINTESVLRTAAYGADPEGIAGLLAAGEMGIRNLVKKGVDKTKTQVAKKMADAKKPTRDEYEPISYKPSASRMRESADGTDWVDQAESVITIKGTKVTVTRDKDVLGYQWKSGDGKGHYEEINMKNKHTPAEMKKIMADEIEYTNTRHTRALTNMSNIAKYRKSEGKGHPTDTMESVGETFKGYDVHHNPDGVMVLVMGSDEDAQDDYYGINVVFKKKGTKPELVTSDDLADRQAAKYKVQIIAAAEKRLGKEEKDHLASL